MSVVCAKQTAGIGIVDVWGGGIEPGNETEGTGNRNGLEEGTQRGQAPSNRCLADVDRVKIIFPKAFGILAGKSKNRYSRVENLDRHYQAGRRGSDLSHLYSGRLVPLDRPSKPIETNMQDSSVGSVISFPMPQCCCMAFPVDPERHLLHCCRLQSCRRGQIVGAAPRVPKSARSRKGRGSWTKRRHTENPLKTIPGKPRFSGP
jgi:hypothetical protein